GALLKRDDGSECPNPGPDLFAVAAVLLLASSPTLRRRLVGKGLSGSTGLSLFSRGLGLRLGTPIGLARSQDGPGDPGGLGRLRQHGDLDRATGEDAALPLG